MDRRFWIVLVGIVQISFILLCWIKAIQFYNQDKTLKAIYWLITAALVQQGSTNLLKGLLKIALNKFKIELIKLKTKRYDSERSLL